MKQGLVYQLAVEFDIDIDTVEKVEFAFANAGGNKPIKIETWPGTVKRQVDSNILLVPFTEAETYKFKSKVLMDTRITLNGTPDQPETPIIELEMNRTLFERGMTND